MACSENQMVYCMNAACWHVYKSEKITDLEVLNNINVNCISIVAKLCLIIFLN